ncbi:hypothetical protein [Ruegeria sp. Ofav3-42]|uniref:hypothetical protein n=1 Tax=Ruegeria sp. Ofav3-42 TaxID=2917759 RepID=UPI001EF6825C|nr:hypothetical protein [Ruegeria sp. Ofav3-42]MCG7518829.1 hypothetical protein [Ruegeria sp. Ofav3-42]
MSLGEDRQPKGARPSLFLERQSYRRRRLTDAARLLPILGAVLIALPLLWPSQSASGDGVPLSSAILYIFTCWALLIVISLIFGFAARRMAANDDSEPESDRWPR